MMEDEKIYPFNKAAELLPLNIEKILLSANREIKSRAREIRLRTGLPLSLTLETKSVFLGEGGVTENPDKGYKITKKDIAETMGALCRHSLYSFQDQLIKGFITAKGGHRAGICGTAVLKNGEVTAVRDISAINIRIAREIKGAASKLYENLFKNGPEGTLIASPPAGGKTTLLRDLARMFSYSGYRVTVVDERGEIAACAESFHGNDLGPLCDVLDGYPKHIGISFAVRTLNPDVIICDEVGDLEDIAALAESLKTGVPVVISAHAYDFDELLKRRVLSDIVREGFVKNIVLLYGNENPGKIKRIVKTGELQCLK